MNLMDIARVAVRGPAALTWTLTCQGIYRTRQILSVGTWRKWRDQRGMDVISMWGKYLARIMGVEIVELNQRSGPMGDVIMSNHMGFMDVPILLTYFPAVFIIKAEALRVPFFGRQLTYHKHVFVSRDKTGSRRSARDGVRQLLEEGDRLIVFPEAYATVDSTRPAFKPFCFHEAARQNKRVEVVVIDYLPDRKQLEWDRDGPMLPQLIGLIGRGKTRVSVEFLPTEIPEDGDESAMKFHDMVEARLKEYDRQRGIQSS